MKAENFHDELKVINGIQVKLTSYKIGDEYYCHVTNIDPGGTIARSAGKTMEEAKEKAWEKVVLRVGSARKN